MRKLFDDLWQTSVVNPFPGVNTHAYVLRCDDAYVLIYSTSRVDELSQIVGSARLRAQYLSHRDEVSSSLTEIADTFDCELVCSAAEAPYVARIRQPDVVLSRRETRAGGLEVIPTPGHTSGSLSFSYASPFGKTYLFTGDALSRAGDRWATLIFPGSGGDEEDVARTLALYREMSPDVIAPSGSAAGTPGFFEMTRAQWVASIDASMSSNPSPEFE